MTDNIYDQHLDAAAANYQALSPLSYLQRAALVYPQRPAVIHGDVRRNWDETYRRCVQLASALRKRGIGKGDTVSIMAPNLPEHFEAHFGVPMCGAVLNSINTRLDAPIVAFILQHAETKLLIVDREMSAVVKKALHMLARPPIVVDIDDPSFDGGELLGLLDYEQLLAEGDENDSWSGPANEWDAITLNYTSGTTGDPKGVVYHHRGAYLNAASNALSWGMTADATYLWTLPMFHCNGWCFPWTMAAIGGASVCLRHVRGDDIVKLIVAEKVDHMCGAPIVLNLIANVDESLRAGLDHSVKVMTAGAPPPPSVLEKMEAINFDVTHVYGLTETYGPCVVCCWKDEWQDLSVAERARLKARQGVQVPMQEGMMVADPETLQPVEKDGETIGEIFLRGNVVMKGYLKNPSTTDESFEGGWFHSGDLAVWHEDGYIEIKDRSKDIIISGGENISSIEVEETLFRHPDIEDAAVVAKPDEKWGEIPCAFVTLADGVKVDEDEIIAYCRQNMAHFKAPRKVIFAALPRTSTGKVQKFKLRQWAKDGAVDVDEVAG
ncbi:MULTISPECIES: acyl-CoA synthetase [unclassified Oceanobacter]|uniref:acyl-CoA synthetase n=1 Tax=unclassified Oceanobacter TaxID=2620260 RepID=UPI0027323C1B|nr:MULTISPECIES: acyl-CoA synthetase [unclassified Oceanobacter]MDP2505113.1 acyl-CoA synthetase [Oceanobacter sp. 3_MG-2023]MDP2548237.1 acyl-CoA synthetase [Oceanobacter sp. 4_MG-2023]MDP2608159.1 acyl-CoA synthetase [Oceanobacter sp. 1_MG-2023]MDP2611179.1 acyl-CoA synthetase [Oceanobacter sp. 2_MG-2023]